MVVKAEAVDWYVEEIERTVRQNNKRLSPENKELIARVRGQRALNREVSQADYQVLLGLYERKTNVKPLKRGNRFVLS